MTGTIKKRWLRALAVCGVTAVLAACATYMTGGVSTSAAEITGDWGKSGVTVTGGGKTLSDVVTDPVTYTDYAENGALVSVSETVKTSVMNGTQTVVFTAAYPYTTTRRSGNYKEYTVECGDDGVYRVTGVNTAGDGSTYIPVGGYVLSVPVSVEFTAAENTVLTLGGTKVALADKAVESDSGRRVAIDLLNGNRSMPMVVYYDYDFGDKTGTNAYGSELAAVFDSESGKFIVKSFRAFGEGDASGMMIPDNGFVLSSYGEGYRGILVAGKRFSLGDKLTMVGFDYVRFGGEPVTYTYNYDYYDSESPTDEFNDNDGRMETPTSPFAAYRGENQTIIYHYGWSYQGSTGTGTNVYGFEAAVDAEGVVVERAVNVTAIPKDGYVISGHGKGRDFIRASVPLGATVTLDQAQRTFSVTTSLNSFYVNTKSIVDSIVSTAEQKVRQLYDIDPAAVSGKIGEVNGLMEELLGYKASIEEKTESGDWTDTEKTAMLMGYNSAKLAAENKAYELLALCEESKPVTARATWHRPTEKNLTDLTATLDTYKETGINLIFLETFYNGYSMFKSDYVEYHKNFASASYGSYRDYVSAFTALAAERGIEVHAWVENFYVGLTTEIKLLAEHPDWIVYNDDGTIYQRKEGGAYIFIDPTNKQTTDFLVAYYKEMFAKNPLLKGINLDYIRYPVSSAQLDTGFTKNSMLAFAESVGVKDKLNASSTTEKMIKDFSKWVLNKAYNPAAEENYEKWCAYRMSAVTDFVGRIYKEVKGDGDLVISTAVFSSITATKAEKKQDWQTWIRNGWIDIATPMAYFDSSTDVLKGVSDMILIAGTSSYYYTGLASSYRGLPAYENVNQIEASYLGGANGYVIFCSTQIIGHEDVQEVLKAGFNSRTAVLPHDTPEKVMKAYFDRILDRADRLYIPAEGMTDANKTALKAKFDEILKMETDTSAQILAVKAEIASLYKTTNISKYAKGFSARRITEALTELNGLLDIKAQRLSFTETPVPPPDPGDSSDSGNSENSGNSGRDERKSCRSGCGSSFALGGLLIPFAAAAAILIRKRRR